ncbi:cytidylate kinase family protein [Patescibacteria group bacterium]|nr:cytidylate kinase family protein [Patescibacteria group bacterium]
MIITLSGLPGSGKTTVTKMIAERLNMKWHSMGDLRGKMAKERGMTIDELNKLGMKEAFTDKEIDEYQKNLGQTEDNFVVDGWMSWHFIPHSLKIFLKIDPDEGARRIFEARKGKGREDEPEYTSLEETKRVLEERVRNSQKRYLKYYEVDYLNPDNYDVIIDTTHMTPEESFQKIQKLIKEKAES